jgi:hypothetical protein
MPRRGQRIKVGPHTCPGVAATWERWRRLQPQRSPLAVKQLQGWAGITGRYLEQTISLHGP